MQTRFSSSTLRHEGSGRAPVGRGTGALGHRGGAEVKKRCVAEAEASIIPLPYLEVSGLPGSGVMRTANTAVYG